MTDNRKPTLDAETRLAMAIESIAAATVSRMRPGPISIRTHENEKRRTSAARSRLIETIKTVLEELKPEVPDNEVSFVISRPDGSTSTAYGPASKIPKVKAPVLGEPMADLFSGYGVVPTEIVTTMDGLPQVMRADVLYRGCTIGRVSHARNPGSHAFQYRAYRVAPRMSDYSLGVFENFNSALAMVIASAGR